MDAIIAPTNPEAPDASLDIVSAIAAETKPKAASRKGKLTQTRVSHVNKATEKAVATIRRSKSKAAPVGPRSRPNPVLPGTIEDVLLVDIVVKDWIRKDLGSIHQMADSLAEVGLLHPVLVGTDLQLIDGFRRINAAQTLGWETIPCRIVDVEDPLLAMVATESNRKSLNAVEKVAVYDALEAKAKNRTWLRQALGGKLADAESLGRRDEFLARHVGLSRETLRQVKAIVKAAREDPERFGDIAESLADGRVHRHFKELRRRQMEDSADPVRLVVLKPGWTGILADPAKTRDIMKSMASMYGGPTVLLVPLKLSHLVSMVDRLRRIGFTWVQTRSTAQGESEKTWLIAVKGCATKEADPWVTQCSKGYDALSLGVIATGRGEIFDPLTHLAIESAASSTTGATDDLSDGSLAMS